MTTLQVVESYKAVTGGAFNAIMVKRTPEMAAAIANFASALTSKYKLPSIDASLVGEGTVGIAALMVRAYQNIVITDDIAPEEPGAYFGTNKIGANWAYFLYPRSFNPATWTGPVPSFINSPEMALRWQIITAGAKPMTGAIIKASIADQAKLVADCAASVTTWDTADRVFTGIATFGASELIAVAKTKIQAAKDKVVEYQSLRVQAQAYLDDPKCPPEVKKQIADSMKYDNLLGLLVGGKLSAAEASAALAGENVDPSQAAELQSALGKTPAEAQGMALDMGAVWAAGQSDAERGLGFAPLAALAAVPVGTMVCIAIVVAIVAGLAIYLLGPALRAAGVAMEALAKATGKIVDTLGGPGLVAVLAIGGLGYYFYKNPGQWGQLKAKLHLK